MQAEHAVVAALAGWAALRPARADEAPPSLELLEWLAEVEAVDAEDEDMTEFAILAAEADELPGMVSGAEVADER